jgi:hypothetical protein
LLYHRAADAHFRPDKPRDATGKLLIVLNPWLTLNQRVPRFEPWCAHKQDQALATIANQNGPFSWETGSICSEHFGRRSELGSLLLRPSVAAPSREEIHSSDPSVQVDYTPVVESDIAPSKTDNPFYPSRRLPRAAELQPVRGSGAYQLSCTTVRKLRVNDSGISDVADPATLATISYAGPRFLRIRTFNGSRKTARARRMSFLLMVCA